MTFTYNCDHCERSHDSYPAFTGKINESYLKTDGGELARHYTKNQTLTVCGPCTTELFTPEE